jgi:hypothetical protein
MKDSVPSRRRVRVIRSPAAHNTTRPRNPSRTVSPRPKPSRILRGTTAIIRRRKRNTSRVRLRLSTSRAPRKRNTLRDGKCLWFRSDGQRQCSALAILLCGSCGDRRLRLSAERCSAGIVMSSEPGVARRRAGGGCLHNHLPLAFFCKPALDWRSNREADRALAIARDGSVPAVQVPECRCAKSSLLQFLQADRKK